MEPAYTYTPNTTKMKSNDRVFVLEKVEGTQGKSTSGMIDNRLFDGGNKLHAKLDPHSMLWSVNMDKGLVPQVLKQQWTSFPKLKDYVTSYYANRGVRVKEIIE